jgi:hypothetical protein
MPTFWFSVTPRFKEIMIRTNDIDRLVRLYVANAFLGIATPMTFELFIWHILCEHETPGMGHKWGYNKTTLKELLECAGFCQIRFHGRNHILI